MEERSFPEVAEDGREQLQDRRAAIRSLADQLEALLGEQLAGLADEEMRAARIAAELEERGRLLTEREHDLIDQRERLQLAEREIGEGRQRLEELRADAEALRAREQALAEAERKQALSEREAVVGELGQMLSEATAARERELTKLQEGLSAAMERAVGVERGLSERDSELTRLRGELDTRVAEVDRRERELSAQADEQAARASEVGEREQGLSEREEQLARREEAVAAAEEAKTGLDARERAAATRDAELDERTAELEARSEQLADAEEEHARRSRSLDEREAQVAERARELDERFRSVAARELLVRRATPEAPVPSDPVRGLQIDRLERLVAGRREEFPERAAEWDAYLFELRSRAGADGTLPHELTGLVEDVFGPLL